jgi:hypothetical protein
MNVLAMVMGVLVFVSALLSSAMEWPTRFLLASFVLFAGYPFALAGHYDLFSTKGARSYRWCTIQESIAVVLTIIALGVALWADFRFAIPLSHRAAAARVLKGQNAADFRRRWKELGDQAFTQD